MTNAELVEKIKRILSDPESVSSEEQQETARAYAHRTHRVVDGFRRALGRVSSELFSDAHRILQDGSLLTEYDSLALPDALAEDWTTVCRTFDYEVAPSLSPQDREDLRSFESLYSGAAELFRLRRRQVMENASSRTQLETLYLLRESLGTQQFIERQIKRLETRRNVELDEAVRGITQENVFGIDFEALVNEFSDERRTIPIPPTTIEKIRSWFDFVRSCNQLAALRELIATWKGAIDAQNYVVILHSLARYRAGEFSGAAKFVTAEETQLLTELIDYSMQVERQNEMTTLANRRLEELRVGILRGENANKLYDLWNAAEVAVNNAGMTISPDLTKEYDAAIHAFERQTSRRRRTVVAVVAVSILFFMTLVAFAVRHSIFVKSATQATELLAAKLDAAELKDEKASTALDAAASLVNENSIKRPDFEKHLPYVEQRSRFDALYAEEKSRLAEIERLCEQIDLAHEEGRNVPKLLENLKSRMRGDAEKEKFGYVERYREDMRLTTQKKGAVADDYSALLDQLVATEKTLNEGALSLAEVRLGLNEVKSGLANLKEKEATAATTGAEITPPLVNARKALETAVEGTERRLKFRVALEENGSKLLPAVGKKSEYLATLAKIKSAVGDISAHSGEEYAEMTERILADALDAAIVDVQSVDAVDSWNKFSASWKTVNMTARNANASKIADTALAPTGLAIIPEYAQFVEARKPLQKFASNGGYEETGKRLKDATSLFTTTTWTLYNEKNDHYYYLTSDPNEKKSNLKYLIDLEKEKTREFPAADLADLDLTTVQPSVQSTIADLFRRFSRNAAEPKEWFDAVEQSFRTLDAADERNLDPIMKLLLLARLIDEVRDYPGFDSLASWLADVRKNGEFEFEVNAYEQGGKLLELRSVARKALRNLPDINGVLDVAKAAFMKGEEKFGGEYQWVGYLDEVNDNPVLALASGRRVQGGATLWIARGKNASMQQIGAMTDDGAEFTAELEWSGLRWTPIYARVAP